MIRFNTLCMYALLAMEVLARHFASHNTQCYIFCMPAVVSAAAGKGGVAASALMCAASFIRALHLQCIPFLGDLMPKLLACIQHDPAKARRSGSSSSSSSSDSSSDDENAPASARASKAEASKGDFTIMEAALTSLAVVATELPQFLSPFLPALVEALLLKHVATTTSSRTRDVLLGCIDAVARGVQHRLLVPLLSEKWPVAVANGGESVKILSGLVAATATNLKQDELQTLLPQLLKFALVSLDLRFSVLSNEDSTIVDDGVVGGKAGCGLESCEESVVAAIIAIVMKLSERRFQPLFTRLVDWGFGGISFTADGEKASTEELQRLHAQAVKDPVARLQICCRHTVMFRLVFALSSSLKAIFAPFFKLVLNRAVTALQFPARIFPVFEQTLSSAESSVSKSKRKRSDVPAAPASAVHMLPLRRACSAWILRALESCCRHDVAALINKERFDMCGRPVCLLLCCEFV
jgi:U3 small nucleolar RNA-associated protein 10